MGTLISILVFFVMFGTLFGLPVFVTALLVRRREARIHQVLKEVKGQYRLRGRPRTQLAGRVEGRPLRIRRDMKHGVVVAVDLLPADVRRRHAQWSRERAESFSTALRRLLAQSGYEHASSGERIEGRWMFRLGFYPKIDAIEDALATIRRGVTQVKLLADVAAAAHEADRETAWALLTEVSEAEDQPSWLRAEAYRGLLVEATLPEQLEAYGRQLSVSSEPALRQLASVAWSQLPRERALTELRELLRDDHPNVVESAARSLQTRSDRDDHDTELVLLQRLKSAQGPLLFVIVRALGAVGSSRALAEMARWSGSRSMSMTLRETVARESARIRSALGLKPAQHGGHLSDAKGGGELSAPPDDMPDDRGALALSEAPPKSST